MIDIAFVILNYNLYHLTRRCIRSIKKRIDTAAYMIVLIDNASVNDAGQRLKKYYNNDPFVEVHLLRENVGFARGNNKGIEIAGKYEPKYVCCLNNDIIFLQYDFFEKLDGLYERTQAALISPLNFRNDYSVNDVKERIRSRADYKEQIKKLWEEVDELKSGKDIRGISATNPVKRFLLKNKLIYFLNLERHMIRNRIIYRRFLSGRIFMDDERENIIPAGCIIIFTPTFLKNLRGFNPDTFMYFEEELLCMDVFEKEMKTLYSSSLYVRHLENISTNKGKNAIQKKQFVAENMERSLAVLLRRMEELDIY